MDVTRFEGNGKGHAFILAEIDVRLDSIEGNYENICIKQDDMKTTMS